MILQNYMNKLRKARDEIIKDVEDSRDMLTVPTFLNVSRIVLTFVLMYMIVVDSNILLIVFVFVIAALTDWFDGFFARKYNLTSDFGRKADMFADRFLWIGTSFAFIFVYGLRGEVHALQGLQILLILTREIISAPFAIAGAFTVSVFPHARYIAKLTTFLQGFALPAVILSVYYPIWTYLSLPLSVAIGVTGAISGLHYIHDLELIREDRYSQSNTRKNKSR